MPIRARLPSPPLRAHVALLWCEAAPEAGERALERVLPTGAAQLVVPLNEEPFRIYETARPERFRELRGALVSGPQAEAVILDRAEWRVTVGAYFRPGGVAPFLPLPPDELRDATVPLALLWGEAAGELHARMLAAATCAQRLRLLEAALAARFESRRLPHPAVRRALRALERPPPAARVADLAAAAGLSARRFGQLFREEVGMPPKLYTRVQRFQRVLEGLEREPHRDWTERALICGYFDQAHLIRDFRDFAGLTPTAYAALRRDHRNHVPLDA